jgi:hypothetical protein
MSTTTSQTFETGSFAAGQITTSQAAADRGRFCTGQERRGESAHLREGGFADGQALFSVAVTLRGRFSTGQEQAIGRHAPIAPPSPIRSAAFARGR